MTSSCVLRGMICAALLAWGANGIRADEMKSMVATPPPTLGPRLEQQVLFHGGRFPNLVVTPQGVLVAVWGQRRVVSRTSRDGGDTWEPEVEIDPAGIHGGGAVVNESNGEVLVFTHPEHPPRQPEPPAPRRMYVSGDSGLTWMPRQAVFHPDERGYVPALHMSEKGITLRVGAHAGRLLRPARVYLGENQRGQKHDGYNTSLYSDDGGVTWHASSPFPDTGTGEGALVELADGTIYYSSRKQYFHAGQPMRSGRDHALSRDGGQTWVDLAHCNDIPDGPRYRGTDERGQNYNGHFGLMAGLDRVTDDDREILLYTSADSDDHERRNLTVWASFDRGRTWPIKRRIHDGPSAYSAVAVGRPGTPSEGWIYVLYEGGDNHMYDGGRVARFSLAWIMQGESSGDDADQSAE
jgi:sialidase-1